MAFTFFFIIVPLLVITLPFIGALIAMVDRTRERQRKIQLHDLRISESILKQSAMIEARLARSMIAESKVAEANNKAMIQDLNIELLNIKIMAARKELNLDAPDFDPDDHGE